MAESTFFFPLQTNVEFFRSPDTYISLQSRIKQSLLLFDRIVFQEGVYHCSIGEKGSFSLFRPYDPEVDDARYSEEKEGKDFYVAVKPTNAAADTPFTPIIQSQRQRSFDSQFHTITDEMKSAGLDGIELLPFSMKPKSKSWAKKTTKKITNDHDIPINNIFLRNSILKGLCLDLLLISDLGWPASIDPLHAPLIPVIAEDRFLTSSDHGFGSLGVTLPSVRHLSWEQLANFRKDPSVVEFRNKMVELEKNARKAISEGATENLEVQVSNLLIDELLSEIRASHKSLLDVGKEAGSDILLEVFGAVFPPASLIEIGVTAKKAIDDIQKIKRENNSWLTAFMRLKSVSREDT